jgi:hypothetical protein
LTQYRARNATSWRVRNNHDPSTVAERIGGIRPNRTGAKRTADQVKADEEASKKAAALLAVTKADTSVPTREQEQVRAYVNMQTRAFAQVLDAAAPTSTGPAPTGMASASEQQPRPRAAVYMLPQDHEADQLWDSLLSPKSDKPQFTRAIDCNDRAPRRAATTGMPDATADLLTPDQRREYDRITPTIDAYSVFNTNQLCGVPSAIPTQLFRLVSGGGGAFIRRVCARALCAACVSDGRSLRGRIEVA